MTIAGVLVAVLMSTGCTADQATGPEKHGASAARSTATGPTVSSTNPSYGQQSVTMDVEVLGSGFDNGSRADWALDGVVDPAKIRTNSTTYVSSKKLIANITIAADAPLDYYDVIVMTTSGKKGIGTEMFEVTQAEDIGTLGGATLSRGINDRGQVVGYSMVGTAQHAFLWHASTGMRDLGRGEAVEIDALGTTIVGMSADRPVVWTTQGTTWLMTTLSNDAGGRATAVASDATGSAFLIVGNNWKLVSRRTRLTVASVWTKGASGWTRTALPAPVQGAGTGAEDVNSNGQVVGWRDDGTGLRNAVVWERANDGAYGYTVLSRLSGDGISAAFAINGAGDIIVGHSEGRPVYWRKTNGVWSSAIALESLGGLCQGALDINNAGHIVGRFCRWTPDGVAHRLGGLGNSGENIDCEAISSAPGAIAAGAAGRPTRVGAIWRLD